MFHPDESAKGWILKENFRIRILERRKLDSFSGDIGKIYLVVSIDKFIDDV